MKNLYIIGNGFDVHHGINSKYCDYRAWLKSNHEEIYNNLIRFYPEAGKKEWWWELEENLGYPSNLKDFSDEIAYNNQFSKEDLDNEKSIDVERGRYDVELELGGLISDIKSTFNEWVNTLNKPSEAMRLNLNTDDSFFLNFNYTLTLENFYNVHKDNVLHIHGKIDTDFSDELILGHGRAKEDVEKELENKTINDYTTDQDPSDFLASLEVDPITSNTREAFCDEIEKIRKKVENIISYNERYFNLFKSVEQIFIYGISFSDVDMKYFDKIVNSVGKNVKYTISYFSTKDLDKINEFIEKHGILISNVSKILLKDIMILQQYELFPKNRN